MIEVRYNGKFFTEPLCAANARLAFELLVEELVKLAIVKESAAKRIFARGFKTALRPADTSTLQFMWDRALIAEENDVSIVFCLFDHGGWRFFGRI